MKRALLCVVVFGCGDNRDVSPDAAAIPRCGPTPTQLVDATSFVPPDAPIGLGVANPFVAVDNGYLYYNLAYVAPTGSPPVGGHIRRMSLAGGGAADIVDSPHPGHFAIASAQLIFADDAEGIRSVPVTGGTASPIAAAAGAPGWLVLDGSTLYFGDAAGIERVAIAGGGVRHVTDELAFSFAPLGDALVLAEFSTGTVASVPAAGGSVTPLAASQLGPLYPVRCGADVCWIDAGDLATRTGALIRFANGAATAIVESADLWRPHGMVGDGASVFAIAEGNGNTITRVSLATGALEVVAHAQGAGDIAVDDDCIYYSSFAGIFSLGKDAPAL